MKRTCETCKHFCQSFIEGQYRCFRTTPAVSREWDSPACEHYELSKSDLEMAFDNSLAKARAKHPVFLDAWPKAEDAEAYLDTAEIHKLDIGKKESTQLHSILFSEVFEFLAEVARGDLDRAIEEAGDVMAVLYRALNGEGRTGDTGDSGDTGNARKGDGEEVGP